MTYLPRTIKARNKILSKSAAESNRLSQLDADSFAANILSVLDNLGNHENEMLFLFSWGGRILVDYKFGPMPKDGKWSVLCFPETRRSEFLNVAYKQGFRPLFDESSTLARSGRIITI